jgi:predicted DNA-binding transcriptional regulator AlpA
MPRRRGRDRGAAKPFLSASELAKLTPLSESAIYTIVSRGVFKRAVHYHKLGRRTVFDWEAVAALIRGKGEQRPRDYRRIPLARGGFVREPDET